MFLFLIIFLEVEPCEWRGGGVGDAQMMRGIWPGLFAILAADGPGFTLLVLVCG